jgi:hypothetical protein
LKKLAITLLIFYFPLLFGFHRQEVIAPEETNSAKSSRVAIRRTVRDCQEGLLDEGLIQQSRFKDAEQKPDSVQNAVFNLD